MKIYFIGQKGMPSIGGGIETYVENLSVELAKLGHEVFVYTRKYYTPAELSDYKGVNLISLPSIKTKHLDTISHCLLASFDVIKKDADIVYYQNIGPAAVSFIPKLFSRAKVISILQSPDYLHKKWGWFARLSLKLGERMLCLVSNEVIVVTKIMQKYVLEKYSRDASIIPNGAKIKKIRKPNEIKKWGLDKGNYIASISRLVGHKGIHYLIEAYKKINTTKKLVIVGDGSYTDDYIEELYSLAMENKNIIFTGNQTGTILEELYSNAYIFVQPSESEGMSLALLEAMSYKKAVLVSDISENMEAVGKAGLTFACKNVRDLQLKLEYLIKRPSTVKKMGELAFQRVNSNFSWDKISRDIIKIFNNSITKDCRQAKTVRFKLAKRFIGLF
jgi:glycosyltransferase involved in cell wall biosynthesis